jgi:hypothetical protein
MRRLFGVILLATTATHAGGCAPHRVSLPSGDGEAFPEYREAFDEATRACRGVRSMTAELAISGRAAGQKLRGRVLAGIATPDRVRLEAVAPFGPPVFILAANGTNTSLLLPRDNRVLTGEPVSAILGALVGLELGPADLVAILSGCVESSPEASAGRSFPGGWGRIDIAGGSAAFLKREGARWTVRAGRRPGLAIEYGLAAGGAISRVRLEVAGGGQADTDVRVELSQVDVNPRLGPEVFQVKVPPDAVPITLADLRGTPLVGEKR